MKQFSRVTRLFLALFFGLFSSGITQIYTAPSAAAATAPTEPVAKVTICHRDRSTRKPYAMLSVNTNSVDVRNGNNDHAGHTGPVWNPGIVGHDKWGDIIPPFTDLDGRTFDGLNWDVTGQMVYANDCVIPTPTVSAVAGPCVAEGSTGSITVTVGQVVSNAVVTVLGSTNTSLFTQTLTNTSSTTHVLNVGALPVGTYTVQVLYGTDVMASTTVSLESCPVVEHVTPLTPTISAICGPNNDIVTLPTQTGVSYTVTSWSNNGLAVTATAQPGYVLDGTDAWRFTDENVPCKADPSGLISDPVCSTEGASVTVSYTNSAAAEISANFTVTVDGVVQTSATLVPGASATYTVTGLSDGSHTIVLLADDAVLASNTVVVDCITPVIPQAPVAYDMCYNNVDTIEIPTTTGIAYMVDDVDKSGSVVFFTGQPIVVTAVAQTGFELTEGSTSSWKFDAFDFTNQSCIAVTKTGSAPVDTNKDGFVSVGDIITWTITVTNTSNESTADWFYITISDPNTILENDGYVGKLESGQSKTLTATRALTVSDMVACKATNTAYYNVWYDSTEDSLVGNLENGSAFGSASFTCPVPGQGGGHVSGEAASTTAVVNTVTSLPATGPADHSNPLLIVFATIFAYGATFFLQNRREIQKSNL